jgi:hypothetical protein
MSRIIVKSSSDDEAQFMEKKPIAEVISGRKGPVSIDFAKEVKNPFSEWKPDAEKPKSAETAPRTETPKSGKDLAVHWQNTHKPDKMKKIVEENATLNLLIEERDEYIENLEDQLGQSEQELAEAKAELSKLATQNEQLIEIVRDRENKLYPK